MESQDLYGKYRDQLASYRIDKIVFKQFRARYPRLHGKNAVRSYHGFGGSVVVAQLWTDQGAMGWGMLSTPTENARLAAGSLQGKKLCEVFDPETGILNPELKAFDIPLHDLAGVILGIPVSRMINPVAVPTVRLYDGAIYMDDIIPEDKPFGMERVLEECCQDWSIGHRALKIKIGRGHRWMEHDEGLTRDIALVNRIHSQLPAAVLMVDANDGYSVEDALAFLEGIEGCDLYWFEEPFRENEDNNRKLKDYLRLRRPCTFIADGESQTDIPLLRSLAQKRLLDVWQPDVCGYGFTQWRRLMKEIAENGWMASPHAWGQVVKTYYCAHLAAAYPHHVPYIEAVLGDSEGIEASGYVLSDGVLSVPQKPGFGMDYIWMEDQ